MLKFIRPDVSTIPQGAETQAIHAVVEEPLAASWFEKVKMRPETILVDDADEFGYDTGGIVHRDEPEISRSFGDWKISLRTRDAEFLFARCRKVHTHMTSIGPHVYLPGYWVHGIFTVETGERIAQWLEADLSRLIAESDQWWAKHYEMMKERNVYVPPRASMAIED